MAAAAHPAWTPVGSFGTFGETGPLYEVLGAALTGPKGDMVSIMVIPSGETLDYPLADVLADPLARYCSPSPSIRPRLRWNAYGSQWKQGSVYPGQDEDMADLFAARNSLKALPWFPAAVRDIRGFRVELWSDFTALTKS